MFTISRIHKKFWHLRTWSFTTNKTSGFLSPVLGKWFPKSDRWKFIDQFRLFQTTRLCFKKDNFKIAFLKLRVKKWAGFSYFVCSVLIVCHVIRLHSLHRFFLQNWYEWVSAKQWVRISLMIKVNDFLEKHVVCFISLQLQVVFLLVTV